jgi:hypothetical protein
MYAVFRPLAAAAVMALALAGAAPAAAQGPTECPTIDLSGVADKFPKPCAAGGLPSQLSTCTKFHPAPLVPAPPPPALSLHNLLRRWKRARGAVARGPNDRRYTSKLVIKISQSWDISPGTSERGTHLSTLVARPLWSDASMACDLDAGCIGAVISYIEDRIVGPAPRRKPARSKPATFARPPPKVSVANHQKKVDVGFARQPSGRTVCSSPPIKFSS